ncbi:tRNA uridine-5-carboxymethylaminomethyl(34) synthesis GTPase MnmE [Peptoniphilus duerdenii]|uniref:tRNA uridine-5-carboxymethylaminomethyl(34) synthesis GTPase MnmE n=1 Tax=Peptoniphilus duerdenii TaxID=507750 RepID=UPI00254AE390|nr:tRNA uridine-5-carboxymethylaminomethyl(34) synthesis GTPase MnmE [Peptoniphilus duerdenii]MDK8276196.1 tRNA uridine-5-carboxymethylaminomethyl(34) synthesis GTPase MnmE [Peptoniphilus duerdenii]
MKETIAAISTATGEAGIGIVRMSGEDSVEIADKVFRHIGQKNLTEIKNRMMSYGHIIDENGKVIDEVLIVKMMAPNTYTRENMVEIYTHGGIISVRRVLNLLLDNGARIAEAGEFTKRAFLNGRLDLSQAEAVIDIIKAKTDESFDQSIKQLEGSLTGIITEISDEVTKMMGIIIANIDFPEDDVEEYQYETLLKDANKVKENINTLIEGSNRGRLLRDGINTVILGKPNVGKSSLLNAMLRYEKAIVTDIPGTTRDIIEDYVNLDGILLKITDTAGIRETEDKVEAIGVSRAVKSIEGADLIIAIFDGSEKFDENDEEILKLLEGKKSIVLVNKADLESKNSEDELKSFFGNRDYMNVSIKKGTILDIENKIKDMFFSGNLKAKEEFYINNLRHVRALKEATKFIDSAIEGLETREFLDCIEVDLRGALDELGNITGETTTEDILDKVFSEFCIGK